MIAATAERPDVVELETFRFCAAATSDINIRNVYLIFKALILGFRIRWNSFRNELHPIFVRFRRPPR
jgi:hypothetical protein